MGDRYETFFFLCTLHLLVGSSFFYFYFFKFSWSSLAGNACMPVSQEQSTPVTPDLQIPEQKCRQLTSLVIIPQRRLTWKYNKMK